MQNLPVLFPPGTVTGDFGDQSLLPTHNGYVANKRGNKPRLFFILSHYYVGCG